MTPIARLEAETAQRIAAGWDDVTLQSPDELLQRRLALAAGVSERAATAAIYEERDRRGLGR